jgi:hypothetical protein
MIWCLLFEKCELEAIKLFLTLFVMVSKICDDKSTRIQSVKLAKVTKTTSTIISRQIEIKKFRSLNILPKKRMLISVNQTKV